ncbi:hypothetical protein BC941DRAFT_418656 [Chlamydoabsidia padenii]|nr:hypothetical protein BC941DRAFT_418656 [Chlamydoabsidia padenii]
MSFVVLDQDAYQNTCSQWLNCQSCVADSGCAYCASLDKCIQGNWFGVVNKTMDYCPVTDYYYKQCQFSSLPLGIMASTVLILLLILVLIGLCYLCCCYSCYSCRSNRLDQDEEERRALLGDRSLYLQRSSTYYQWNRSPPPSTITNPFKHQSYCPSSPPSTRHYRPNSTTDVLPLDIDNNVAHDTWESRRVHLLKKYSRDPSSPPSTPLPTSTT